MGCWVFLVVVELAGRLEDACLDQDRGHASGIAAGYVTLGVVSDHVDCG